jgi:transposase
VKTPQIGRLKIPQVADRWLVWEGAVVDLEELVSILDLQQQGLSVSAISRRTGFDRKTVRKYIKQGLTAPTYSARPPRPTVIDPFARYLAERVAAFCAQIC